MTPRGSRSRLGAIRRFGAIAVAGVFAAGCASRSTSAVVSSAAHAGEISVTAAGPGVFAAAVDVPVVLGYRGTITTVGVVPGQKVAAGDPLFGVSSSGLDNVAGKLGLRASALTATATKLARASAPAATVAAAQAQAALAQNALDTANAGRGEIRSPIAGTVGDISASPGASVSSDETLVHVLDLSHLTVSAELATSFFGLVHPGMAAVVRVDGQSATPQVGVVTAVAPVVSAGGQTFTIVVAVDDPVAAATPGLNAYVSVPLTVDAAVEVNSLAVLNADSAPTVFVINGSQARQRSVVLGISDGVSTQIVSGLMPGDRVVIAGAQGLTDGASVTVKGTS